MYAAALKDRIGALPGNQFTQAWECIETIDEALEKAGPTAVLALTYVRVLHEERLAQLLRVQEARIANLISNMAEMNQGAADLATSRDKAVAHAVKLQNQVTRLKRKKTSRR